MSDKNFLNLTGLTFADIVQQVNDTLAGDPRFENFRESAIAKTIIEIFAAGVDLTNHYLERKGQESYLDTAKLKSSVILLSRMIGYVPIRPIPAQTSMKMIISGPLPPGLTNTDQIILSAGTVFDYNGTPFRLNKSYVYTLTSNDISLGASSTFSKEIQYSLELDSSTLSIVTDPSISAVDAGIVKTIDLLQGEVVTTTFPGSSNDLVGQIFQRYKVSDSTASNLYGTEDFGYDNDSDTFDYDSNLTRVTVGGTEFRIDRRSLFNNKTIFNFSQTSATENMCVLRSSIDEGLELVFGDDNYARVGARSRTDDIVLSYFSTLGATANKTGVIGDLIKTDAQFVSNSIDLTSNITFKFTKNITKGADFEDIESIRFNAPGVFYSLDRLVNTSDYVSYLKSITSPINVKNAIAWGEQEEGQGVAIKKLANVVLFSVLGELYKKDTTTLNWNVKTLSGSPDLSDALLDGEGELTTNYLNVLVKENVVDEIRLYSSAAAGYDNIKQLTDKLNTKSQITVRHIYLKPIIQEFSLPLVVYAKKFSDLNNVRQAVKNKVYSFLNENADFAKPVYKSNLIELIESIPQVSHVDFSIEPNQSNIGSTFDVYSPAGVLNATSAVDIVSWWSTTSKPYSLSDMSDIYVNAIYSFILSGSQQTSGAYLTTISDYQYLFSDTVAVSATTAKRQILEYLSNVTERNFYNVLIKKIYNDMKDYETNYLGLAETDSVNRFTMSDQFVETVVKLHNSFSYIIKYNMLKNENVEFFSLRNEIAKFTLDDMSVVYS